jgi:PPM family protein phosphatase
MTRMEELLQLLSNRYTHPGRKRENNEDFVTAYEPPDFATLSQYGCLYIVADGVGGASRGEKASQFAAQKVLHAYYSGAVGDPGEKMANAIKDASREIYQFSQREEVSAQMATTMVAALVLKNQLIIANVGDSRAYLIHNGVIEQITKDHSYTGELMEEGVITEEESLTTKGKNRLTRSIGGESSVKVDVFAPIPLSTGDHFILCSDGLTRYALKNDILQMASDGNPEEISARLVDFANRSGGADNVTVVTVEVGQPLSHAMDTVVIGGAVPRLPGAVDWETMDTDYSGLSRKGSPPKKKRNLIPIYALLVVFVLGLGATIVVMGVKLFSVIPSTTPTPTLGTETVEGVTIPTPEMTPIFTLRPLVAETATINPTEIPTDTPVPSATAEVPGECLYPGNLGTQTLSSALAVFKQTHSYDTIYYYRYKTDSGFSERILIENHNVPRPATILPSSFYFVIDGVLPQTCSNNGGISYP